MNKKGMTLIEIIISIVLISIVLIFLFSLLITVKDINDESKVNSTYLINKSLILKNIESDLSKAESVTLSKCNGSTYPIQELYSNYGMPNSNTYFEDNENLKKNKCLKFIYEKTVEGVSTESVAYLGIYYYKSKDSYVISYIHDDIKATRLLPDFEDVPFNLNSLNDASSGNYITWKHNGNDLSSTYLSNGKILLSGFHLINIPIIGNDGKDYSINISYYK